MDDEITPPRKTYQLRTAEKFERVNEGPSAAKDDQPIDVYQMRADQQAIEHQAGVDELKPPAAPIINRRRRDFWVLMTLNSLFFGSAAYFGQGNPMIFACGVAGIFIGSVGCYWILYQIMGRY